MNFEDWIRTFISPEHISSVKLAELAWDAAINSLKQHKETVPFAYYWKDKHSDGFTKKYPYKSENTIITPLYADEKNATSFVWLTMTD